MPYPEVNTLEDDLITFEDRKGFLSAQITHLSISKIREAYICFVKFTDKNPTASGSFVSYELPGNKKFSSIPSDSTAFHSRKPFYNVAIVQRWMNEEDDKIAYES